MLYHVAVGCDGAGQMMSVLQADGGLLADLVVAPLAVCACGCAAGQLLGGVPAKDSMFFSRIDYHSLPSIYTT